MADTPETSYRHAARPALARPAQPAFRRGAADPRRWHQVQRAGKDQRHRIFDFRRLDPRRRGAQPRPLRPADDDQASGQGRALFRGRGSARRAAKESLPPDRTARERRRSRHFLNAQPPSVSGRQRGNAAPGERRRAVAEDRALRALIAAGDLLAQPRARKLPIIRRTPLRCCSPRRAGAGECSQLEHWEIPPSLGWRNLPISPAQRSFSQFSGIGTILE